MTILHAFDLDGTLLMKNSSFAFSLYLYRKKVFRLADFLFCCSCYFQHRVFKRSLFWLHNCIFKRLFQGKKIALFEEHLNDFLNEYLSKMTYLPAMLRLQEAQKRSYTTLILSTSPIFLVEKIAKRLHVENYYATSYVIGENGVMQELKLVVDGVKKAHYLNQYRKKYCASETECVAYSDSSLDFAFLKSANFQVAVRPDRKLRRYAKCQGWEIL